MHIIYNAYNPSALSVSPLPCGFVSKSIRIFEKHLAGKLASKIQKGARVSSQCCFHDPDEVGQPSPNEELLHIRPM